MRKQRVLEKLRNTHSPRLWRASNCLRRRKKLKGKTATEHGAQRLATSNTHYLARRSASSLSFPLTSHPRPPPQTPPCWKHPVWRGGASLRKWGGGGRGKMIAAFSRSRSEGKIAGEEVATKSTKLARRGISICMWVIDTTSYCAGTYNIQRMHEAASDCWIEKRIMKTEKRAA